MGSVWEKYIYKSVSLASGSSSQQADVIECTALCFYDGQPCRLFVIIGSICHLGTNYINTDVVTGMPNELVNFYECKLTGTGGGWVVRSRFMLATSIVRQYYYTTCTYRQNFTPKSVNGGLFLGGTEDGTAAASSTIHDTFDVMLEDESSCLDHGLPPLPAPEIYHTMVHAQDALFVCGGRLAGDGNTSGTICTYYYLSLIHI